MAEASSNAAIYYAEDGYKPADRGINGRRVAGASFLSGFFRHAQVDEFVSYCPSRAEADSFRATLTDSGRVEPHRNVVAGFGARMAPVGTLYYPAAGIAHECWMRHHLGQAAYTICGITHTISTDRVMRGLFDMRVSPQAPWDALICTSRAVHAAVTRALDITDDHLRARFGGAAPRPLLPVIPLGIDTGSFITDQVARAALRQRMGWADDDVVVVTLARLSPYEKFDPAPLYLALEAAQARLHERGKRLHFVACGIYCDDHSRMVFEGAAAALMPSVPFHHLDGAEAQPRRECLSGGDIFAFPIDNIQETFGIAPVEAMAAGLPVVASDWDGLRDTVSRECGILVPTRTGSAQSAMLEAESYFAKHLKYPRYLNNVAGLTSIDLGALTEAFVTLAADAGLRRRMGAAGQARARVMFDWAQIIPRYQETWREQDSIRRASVGQAPLPGPHPLAPSPFDFFAGYPSHAPGLAGRVEAAGASDARLTRIYDARRFQAFGGTVEKLSPLKAVLGCVNGADKALSVRDAAGILGWNPVSVERAMMFLLKYGLIRLTKG